MNGDKEDEASCGDDGGDDGQVDLDTRLKMLMKGGISSAVPAFLLEGVGKSDDENVEVEDELAKIDLNKDKQKSKYELIKKPLSRPPSPFLSEKIYLEAHKEWLAEEKAERKRLR